MRKTTKVLWGLGFLLAAVLLIAGNFYDVPVSDILIMLAMVILLTEGIIHRNFALILFPAAIVLIINSDRLGMPELSPWSVLAAALFGSIGLSVLFPHRGRHWRHWRKTVNFHGNYFGSGSKRVDGIQSEKCERSGEEFVQANSEGEVHLENSFGETAKYLNGELSGQVCLENSFGVMLVYFDNAVLKEHSACVRASSSFGNIVLYIPAVWNVVICADTAFGGVTEKGKCNRDSVDTLEIKAQASFGAIEIRYI